jgi:hypothetical protein
MISGAILAYGFLNLFRRVSDKLETIMPIGRERMGTNV